MPAAQLFLNGLLGLYQLSWPDAWKSVRRVSRYSPSLAWNLQI